MTRDDEGPRIGREGHADGTGRGISERHQFSDLAVAGLVARFNSLGLEINGLLEISHAVPVKRRRGEIREATFQMLLDSFDQLRNRWGESSSGRLGVGALRKFLRNLRLLGLG